MARYSVEIRSLNFVFCQIIPFYLYSLLHIKMKPLIIGTFLHWILKILHYLQLKIISLFYRKFAFVTIRPFSYFCKDTISINNLVKKLILVPFNLKKLTGKNLSFYSIIHYSTVVNKFYIITWPGFKISKKRIYNRKT